MALGERETINAKIKRGIDQLDRGEGIPEDRLNAYLADLKAKLNERSLRSCARSSPGSCPNLALHQEAKQRATT